MSDYKIYSSFTIYRVNLDTQEYTWVQGTGGYFGGIGGTDINGSSKNKKELVILDKFNGTGNYKYIAYPSYTFQKAGSGYISANVSFGTDALIREVDATQISVSQQG